MKIQSIDVSLLQLRLKGMHSNALAAYDTTDEIYVRITTDSGVVGRGSTAPKYYITGETPESVVQVLGHRLVPAVLGMDPFALGAVHRRMDAAVVGNPSAKTAIDIALFDTIGQSLGVPVYELLGGKVREHLETFELVPTAGADQTRVLVEQFLAAGARQIKLKVGHSDHDDLARVMAVRSAFPDLHLKVDANQSWQPKEAVRMCRSLADAGVDMVEQPVNRQDIPGLVFVTSAVDIDVVGDEVVGGPRSVLDLIHRQAVDVFNIKLIKAGGLYRAKQMAAIAEAAQMKCMAGATVQNLLLDVATVHFMASTSNVDWHEIKGPSWIVDDVVSGLQVIDGKLLIPEGPGLGVTLDDERLDRYRITF